MVMKSAKRNIVRKNEIAKSKIGQSADLNKAATTNKYKLVRR